MEKRRSSRTPARTATYNPSAYDKPSAPKKSRTPAWQIEPKIPMDLEEASSSSSRIDIEPMKWVDPSTLISGNYYSIQHKYEGNENITDPQLGIEAGQPESKDKYYTRFKGRFVKQAQGSSLPSPDGRINGVGITSAKRFAVFTEVSIISKNKQFFTRELYILTQNEDNITFGNDIITLGRDYRSRVPIDHSNFKKSFNDPTAKFAFNIDDWKFANDVKANRDARENPMLREMYADKALDAFANPINPELVQTRNTFAPANYGPGGHISSFLEKTAPNVVPENELSTRGSDFDPYTDVSKMYTKKGGSRRKTRKRKIRRNKTRSKKRKHSTRRRK